MPALRALEKYSFGPNLTEKCYESTYLQFEGLIIKIYSGLYKLKLIIVGYRSTVIYPHRLITLFGNNH